MSGLKKRNEYVNGFKNYDKIPKSVWAAIAISLANRIHGDDKQKARYEIFLEWSILHQNGIIPQRPW
jgi:hypothetical protein